MISNFWILSAAYVQTNSTTKRTTLLEEALASAVNDKILDNKI